MFRSYFVGVMMMILGFYMNAQDCHIMLGGQILDRATKEPLEFSVIGIVETSSGVVTDSNGFFQINNLCAGAYHIQIDHLGCAQGKYFIKIQRDTTIIFYLDHHAELLREITVEGRPAGNDLSQTQHVISGRAIKDQAGQTLSDIAEHVAGVRSLRNGSGIAKPIIHGLFGNRVALINNGLLQAGQQWGADHAPEIDPNSASSITIVKGSDAIEYGSQALGGAVLVEAGPIDHDPHFHGTIGYGFQSNGSGHNLYGKVSRSFGKIDARWVGTLKKEGDHKTPDYYLTNTGATETNTSMQLIYHPNQRVQHQLYYSLFHTELGIFAGSHISNLTDLEQALETSIPFNISDDFSYEIAPPKQRVLHHLWKYSGKNFFANESFLEWSYGLQFNHREEFDIRRGARSEIPALDLKLWSHVLDAKYFNQKGKVHYKTGIQGKWTDNTNDFETGILPLIPDYREGSLGMYLTSTLPSGNVIFDWGARYDLQFIRVWAISTTLPREIINRNHVFHDAAFAAGLLFKTKRETETRLNNVLTRRTPEVNELYSNGLHQGIAGIEEGNQNLKSETSIKSTLTQSFLIPDAFHIELTGHSNILFQYIYLKYNDELRLTIRGAFPVYVYSQEDAWIRGLDVTIVSDFSHQLEWTSKLSLIKGTSLKHANALTFIPPAYLYSSLSWSFTDQAVWKGTKVSLVSEYTARQNKWDESTELSEPPPDYLLLGISLESGIQLGSNMLLLRLQMDNMLNVKYRDYLNRLRYFSDEEGRSIHLALRYEF